MSPAQAGLSPATPGALRVLLMGGQNLTFGVPGERTARSAPQKLQFIQESITTLKQKTEGFP